MKSNPYVMTLRIQQQYFHNTISKLDENDSLFKPEENAFTVAQQVAHTAHSVDWLTEGAFAPEGFRTDWDVMVHDFLKYTSLTDAKRYFDEAIDRACVVFGSKSEEEMMESLPDGLVLGGMPRATAVSGIADHTAHHRGSLSIYSRLVGKPAPFPYQGEE